MFPGAEVLTERIFMTTPIPAQEPLNLEQEKITRNICTRGHTTVRPIEHKENGEWYFLEID
jgi:hypothetical protein